MFHIKEDQFRVSLHLALLLRQMQAELYNFIVISVMELFCNYTPTPAVCRSFLTDTLIKRFVFSA